MRRIPFVFCASVFLLVCLSPSLVAGQSVGLNLTWNHSVRFCGMGGAGTGAPWGRDTNHWANPAALAFREGLGFRNYRSQVAAGLADDMELTHRELTLGNGTWSVLAAVGPGLGTDLDLGSAQYVDEDNNVVGGGDEFIRSNSIGGALRLDSWLEQWGGSTWRSAIRRADLAFGTVYHDNKQDLGPDWAIQDAVDGGETDSWAVSWGFQGRIRLLDYMPDESRSGGFGVRLGLGLGWATLNDTRSRFELGDSGREGVQYRMFTRGWSARLALPVAAGLHRTWAGTGTGRLLSMLDPWVSVLYTDQITEPGIVWNEETGEYEYDRDGTDARDERGKGWEIVVLNVFSLRRGHVEALYGDIDGDTRGWGLKLEIPEIGGLRYDYAEYPQAIRLPDVERKEWSIWVDVLALIDRKG